MYFIINDRRESENPSFGPWPVQSTRIINNEVFLSIFSEAFPTKYAFSKCASRTVEQRQISNLNCDIRVYVFTASPGQDNLLL